MSVFRVFALLGIMVVPINLAMATTYTYHFKVVNYAYDAHTGVDHEMPFKQGTEFTFFNFDHADVRVNAQGLITVTTSKSHNGEYLGRYDVTLQTGLPFANDCFNKNDLQLTTSKVMTIYMSRHVYDQYYFCG